MKPLDSEILTERLFMRYPTREDAEEVFSRYGHDIEVARYVSWTPHQSLTEAEAYLERAITERENGRTYSWLIYWRDGGPLLGSIGCSVHDTRLQFGYCLARDSWGRGIATEAAKGFLRAVFRDDSVWRVQAYCDVENPASARVLEKAGLHYEGRWRRYIVFPNLGPEPRDVLGYAIVRESRNDG